MENKTKEEVIVITSERTELNSSFYGDEITRAELYKIGRRYVSFLEYDNKWVASYHLGGMGGDLYMDYSAETFDWSAAKSIAEQEIAQSNTDAGEVSPEEFTQRAEQELSALDESESDYLWSIESLRKEMKK